MNSLLAQISKWFAEVTMPLRAALRWSLLPPSSRKRLAKKGIRTLFDFLDLRQSFPSRSEGDLFDWIATHGIGLVKEPPDLYSFMRTRLDDEPDFAFVPRPSAPRDVSVGMGFSICRLPSGARFYSSPYEIGTPEATTWLFRTSEEMGFVPPWRSAV